MKTMTLRNVPDEVVERIAALAKESRQSLNGTAVQALRRSVGLEGTPRRKRDLSCLAGSWSQKDFDVFERAVSGFGEIDGEFWRT